MVHLETERVQISPLQLTDAPFIFTLLNSPGWLRFIGDRGIRTLEDAGNFILNGPLKSYRENGFGLCLVSEKSSGEKIGLCGLLKRINLDHPDLGYAFLPEYNGKGYALEAANAMIRYAAETLQLKCLYAFTDPENLKSMAVLGKSGFQFLRPMPWPNSADLSLFVLKLPADASQ